MRSLWFATALFLSPLIVHAAEVSEDAFVAIGADEATSINIEAIAETGYFDEQKRYVVDLLEQDYAYLAVRVETDEGRPIQGVVPQMSITGGSQLLKPTEVDRNAETDEFGVIEFAVVGGPMGLDKVSVNYGKASTEILVNVISLRSVGFPTPPAIDGGIPWASLMKAKVQYQESKLVASFPADIQKLAGQTVKLSGFMVPLEPELKQSRFLLTSNPPGCYFHVPGGPAGAVEIMAVEGIENSWNPIVLEGRFEPLSSSEVGVVYQLHDARLVTP